MPPAVGYAETSSDMHRPMMRMNVEMIGQPQEMAIGPPFIHAWPNVVKQPDRIEMMENEMAKLEKPLQPRCSSCLYPSSASRFSSASCGWKPVDGDAVVMAPPQSFVRVGGLGAAPCRLAARSSRRPKSGESRSRVA